LSNRNLLGGGRILNFVKVIKGGTTDDLELKINEVLDKNKESNLLDIKFSGAFDGKNDDYLAVIIFRK
jgi:hypothetical protein